MTQPQHLSIQTPSAVGSGRQGRRRGTRLAVRAAVVVTVVGASLQGLSSVASAAIVEPPPMPFTVTIFPQRDFVSVEWDGTGKPLSFDLTRNGVAIGHAQSDQVNPPLRTDPERLLEVNHPGGLCWSGSTPDVLPGDRLMVTETSNPADGVAATTLDVTAEPAEEVGTDLVVHGTAFNADGSPMSLDSVEQRVINAGFRDVGLPRRDIRATTDPGPGDGLLAADPLVAGGWIATYDSLTTEQRAVALAGETRGMAWQGVNAAGDRLGVTIYEAGLTGGPGMPECPAAANYTVAASTPSAVNLTNLADGLTLSGAARDASSVTISLDDQDPGTQAVTASTTPSPASGAQSYSVTFTGADVSGLSDGPLTASSSFTVPAGTISGTSRTIEKDTVAPAAPTSDVPAGQYPSTQVVTLTRPAGEPVSSLIRYTTDGAVPDLNSSAVQPVAITSSRTLKAVVIDRAGNVSPVVSMDYFIEPTILSPSTPDLSAVSDSGQSSTDDRTNKTTVTMTGTGTPGATVDVMSGATTLATTTVTPGGLWSADITLAAGVNLVRAEAFGVHQPTRKASPELTVTVDRTVPTVTARTPAARSTGIARGANVVVRFGEAMSRGSMSRTSVIVKKKSGGPAVAGTLTYNATTRSLTINPGGGGAFRLAPDTAYRVTLTNGVSDIAGNALAATTWTFRTL